MNAMSELQFLVEKHDIKHILYHPCNLGIIYDLLGSQRKRRFINENSDIEMNEQEEWKRIMLFLRREIRNREKFVLSEKARTQTSEPSNKLSNYDTKNRTFIVHIERQDGILKACQGCQAMWEEEQTS